jgi:hypothetical protein
MKHKHYDTAYNAHRNTSFSPDKRYEATRALEKIKHSHAFNVPGYQYKKKINQHATLYHFADNSRMVIYHSTSRADCFHLDWKGTAQDVHLGPIKGTPIKH